MKDPKQLRKDNLHAAIREGYRLQAELNEKEAILGLPRTNLSAPISIADLRKRLAELTRLAAEKIDPNEDGTQRQPIYWGDLIQK